MTGIDILILIVIGVGAIHGLMRGFLHQLASLVGLVAGLFVARTLYGAVGEYLAPTIGTSVTVAQILAFILIWLIVPLALLLMASILTKALKAIHMGWLNRWLGAGLGAVKCMLIVGMVIHAIEFIDKANALISTEQKQQSQLYYPMNSFADLFYPVITKAIGHKP